MFATRETSLSTNLSKNIQIYMLIRDMIVILIIVLFGKDYHNGWFTGCDMVNSTMKKKMRVAYEDGTDDYFAEDDIDGVEIIDY